MSPFHYPPTRNVYVWDVESQRLLYKLPGHLGSVNDVDFHSIEPIVLRWAGAGDGDGGAGAYPGPVALVMVLILVLISVLVLVVVLVAIVLILVLTSTTTSVGSDKNIYLGEFEP